MKPLETRQLRYFTAVAEELHFGRAAARLGMAQPPLSRAVQELERQLGVRLLERTTRRVGLTPAGEVLLAGARTVLEAVAAAERRTRHAGASTPRLRLALKADYDAGLLPGVLAAYERADAAVPVDLLLGGRGEQAPALREGRADVALIPTPFDHRGLDVEPLLTEPRVAALAASDPLADGRPLRLADLAGRSLPDGSPAERGLPDPDDEPPAAGLDLAQIFNLVELGRMVHLPPLSVAALYARPGIAFRPVSDLRPSTLVVAWPQDSTSPAVAAFVRAATAVATTAGSPVALVDTTAPAPPSPTDRGAQPPAGAGRAASSRASQSSPG